jgi:hypothetical protein
LSKPRSAKTTGIRVTFSDRIYDLLMHYEVDGFYCDFRTEEDIAKAPRGKAAMVAAVDAATRSGSGWKMVVAPEALDYFLAPTGFCENTLDIFSCGGGDEDERPYNVRAVRAFCDRMKALRAAQQSA